MNLFLISIVLLATMVFKTSLQYSDVEQKAFQFSVNALRQIEKENLDKSVVFSPTSATILLALLYAGAGGKTAKQFGALLGNDEKQVTDYYGQLFNKLNDKNSKVAGRNLVIVDQCFALNKSYKKFIDDYCNGCLQQVNIKNDAKRLKNQLNWFIKNVTNNLIPILIDNLDPNTQIMLINALYFHGQWKTKFTSLDGTYRFWVTPTEIKMVKMMSLEEKLPYFENTKIKLVSIPYKIGTNVDAIFAMPSDESEFSMEGFLQILGTDFLDKIRPHMNERTVKVKLPRFKIECTHELSSLMQSLGLTDAFNPHEANFTRMTTDTDLSITNFMQKAVIEVDEKGTIAAAASKIKISFLMMRDDPTFYANRPFVLMLIDNSSNVFFNAIIRMENGN